jgi:hypothetical protein
MSFFGAGTTQEQRSRRAGDLPPALSVFARGESRVVSKCHLKAVIIGVVTDGWLKGNLVEADYTQIQCSHDGITADCYQGALDILRGPKH